VVSRGSSQIFTSSANQLRVADCVCKCANLLRSRAQITYPMSDACHPEVLRRISASSCVSTRRDPSEYLRMTRRHYTHSLIESFVGGALSQLVGGGLIFRNFGQRLYPTFGSFDRRERMNSSSLAQTSALVAPSDSHRISRVTVNDRRCSREKSAAISLPSALAK
jgi:hypothetical protein